MCTLVRYSYIFENNIFTLVDISSKNMMVYTVCACMLIKSAYCGVVIMIKQRHATKYKG